jgi:hypothetical protein
VFPDAVFIAFDRTNIVARRRDRTNIVAHRAVSTAEAFLIANLLVIVLD